MKACVFDLDGTLLNTLEDIANACNHVLAAHNYPQHPVSAYMRMVGNGFDKLAQRALPPDAALEACALQELTQQMRQRYADHMLEMTAPYPGMTDALKNLLKKGFGLAVLSNKPDTMTKAIIAHYFPDISFFQVQGAAPEIPLKPNPETLLHILANAEAKAEESFYIGDSDVDMNTARNAHIRGIGAAWGFRGANELAAAGAFKVLNAPAELAFL